MDNKSENQETIPYFPQEEKRARSTLKEFLNHKDLEKGINIYAALTNLRLYQKYADMGSKAPSVEEIKSIYAENVRKFSDNRLSPEFSGK